MLYPITRARPIPLVGDGSVGLDPVAAARHALARLRSLLRSFTPSETGSVRESALGLRASLTGCLVRPEEEAERLFLLGWLRWLEGKGPAAIPLFEASSRQAEAREDRELWAEAAYWRARVTPADAAEGLVGYEAVLRQGGGLPRATAWFVDLLWRAGQAARAGQVWKVARARCLTTCPEGAVIEARMLLQRDELLPAERLLREAQPTSGVAWVERCLLQAWVAVARRQHERGREHFDEAGRGPYPTGGLERWRRVLQLRTSRDGVPLDEASAPAVVADFLRGQQARLQGDAARAAEAYREVRDRAPAGPFARYALACLGDDDFADVLAANPGLFLALRCRARLAGERFCRREASPAEFLDADRLATSEGYSDPGAEPLRQLAEALRTASRPEASEAERTATLDRLLDRPGPENQRDWCNHFRAALEIAAHLPPDVALDRLLAWADLERLRDEGELPRLLGRQLLRCLLLGEEGWETGGMAKDVLSVAERLCPDEPALALVETLNPGEGVDSPGADAPGSPGDAPVPHRLWRAAQTLHRHPEAEVGETWRAEVAGLREGVWRGAAQTLLLVEAARRRDVEEVARLLGERDHWRGLRPCPPPSLLPLLEHLVVGHPQHPGLKNALARWLDLWDPATLGPAGKTLAGLLGLCSPEETLAPPAGIPARTWWLYQTSRALAHEDAVAALANLGRAAEADPSSLSEAQAELERRAAGQRLVTLGDPREGGPRPPRDGGGLADAVDLLREREEGRAVLEALASADQERALSRLEGLAELPDLPPRLAHHLALIEQGRALALEEREAIEPAVACWQRSWAFWLRFLAGEGEVTRSAVADWLLARHRNRVNDLLAQGAVDRARGLWDLVRRLPEVRPDAADLGAWLAARVERFRDQLATEYLANTREAMRYGAIPEGWRSDYEKGLTHLRRLLSMDQDNLRLLTALVEVCGEWFLDLYNCDDRDGLRGQVGRFTPFARQLARLTEGRPAELPARAALSEFYKFRGFVAADPEEKAALYREALRLNPANDNARELLAGLEGEEGEH